MSKLQNELDALQPYVFGIRYTDGTPIVDTIFKDNWILPNYDNIKKVKASEELNYFMIFSDVKTIGLDELLDYVRFTIKTNIDREKKHELLRERVNELKELFKNNTLTKLKTLTFSFNNNTDIDLFEIDNEFMDDNLTAPADTQPLMVDIAEPERPLAELPAEQPPLEYSEEEAEIMAEELRAQNFKMIKNSKKLNNVKPAPPAKKVKILEYADSVQSGGICDCEPNEACDKCIDNKDL